MQNLLRVTGLTDRDFAEGLREELLDRTPKERMILDDKNSVPIEPDPVFRGWRVDVRRIDPHGATSPNSFTHA